MAHQHQRAIKGDFAGAGLQLGQGDQQAAGQPTIGALVFLGGAHIQEGDLPAMGDHPGRIELGQAGITELHRSPGGRRLG